MSISLPVAALSVLGILITVLGLFAAGNMAVVALGLLALFGAGLLEVVGRRRSSGGAAVARPPRRTGSAVAGWAVSRCWSTVVSRRQRARSHPRPGGSGSSIGGRSGRPVISRVPRPWVRKLHAQRTMTTSRLENPIR